MAPHTALRRQPGQSKGTVIMPNSTSEGRTHEAPCARNHGTATAENDTFMTELEDYA